MSALSVGANLLWLVPGEVGGSEQSTVTTLRGLADRPDLDMRVFALPGFRDAHPEVAAATTVEVAPVDGRSRPRRVLAEATWLHARTAGLDVVHHMGGTVPIRRRSPAVLTLHDIQPLEATETHRALKRAYLRVAIPAALRGARRVAVPSEHVRRSVLARFAIPPERVVVIPHAVPQRPPATPPAVVRERYGIPGPAVLYAAITYPHKDHATLLQAFEAIATSHPDVQLVLPGGAGGAEAAVRDQIEASAVLRARTRRLGRIPEADLAGLLELATVVAVPSRYEGFGLPALEAMAAGVPVVASATTSLPEVVGDAGVLLDPGDPAAWAEALDGLLADDARRADLGSAGRLRAAGYSVEVNAERFAALYRDAAGP